MAEGGQGGDLPSLKDGSDADFEIKCTPCGEDNFREEAVKYCPECHEYLCTTCTRHHGRQKATRSHRLLGTDGAKHGPTVASKCLYHSDRDIEMYCRTHDMVYCTMCIATEHRSCSGVDKIDDEQLSTQDIKVQSLLDETKSVSDSMKAMTIKQQNNIESLEEQRKAIQQSIIEVERKIIEHTRKLKCKLLDSFEKDYTTIKAELESERSEATHMVKYLEKTTKQFQTIADAGPRQQFVQLKLIQKAIADAKMLHKNGEASGKVFHFTENTELMTSVTTATALAQVIVKTEERRKPTTHIAYKMKSKKEIDVHMPSDKTCRITDVCQLEDGTILLTDEINKNLKRLDTNHTIKDHYNLDASPRGICCIDRTEVAVKMNDKIQFISVGVSLSKTRSISITNGDQRGIICCNGELWVSRHDGVDAYYSSSGTLIKSIDKNQNSKVIFETPHISHMAVSDGYVIVTDQGDGAVCLNMDGTVRRELRDGRLSATTGVCVTYDGTVFLSGYESHNIVMFSSEGRCLGELVSKDAGLKKPSSLCYDRNKDCIIVTCDNNNSIHIVELSK